MIILIMIPELKMTGDWNNHVVTCSVNTWDLPNKKRDNLWPLNMHLSLKINYNVVIFEDIFKRICTYNHSMASGILSAPCRQT